MAVCVFDIFVQNMARTGFFETYLQKLKKDKLKQKKKEKANELKEKTNLYHIKKVQYYVRN